MNLKKLICFIPIAACIFSCSSLRKAKEIEDGKYVLSRPFAIDSLSIDFKDKEVVYIEDFSDYIILYGLKDMTVKPVLLSSKITSLKPFYARQNSFDIDLFTVPFKIRPAQANVPVQFNTSFNASMYFGFRRDFIKIFGEAKYADILKRKVTKNGIGAGVFLGGGPVPINPTVTIGRVSQEYDGLSISYGISSIFAVEKFNAGISLGFDYLTDRNKDVWIYQNKLWIGILVGFNLN